MGVKGQVTTNPAGIEWKDKRYDYTSGSLDYAGFSLVLGAATDAGDLWKVWKYTWSGENLTRVQGPVACNWDDRAASF